MKGLIWQYNKDWTFAPRAYSTYNTKKKQLSCFTSKQYSEPMMCIAKAFKYLYYDVTALIILDIQVPSPSKHSDMNE